MTGVGIDLLEIDRLERALERRPRLAERVFTERKDVAQRFKDVFGKGRRKAAKE